LTNLTFYALILLVGLRIGLLEAITILVASFMIMMFAFIPLIRLIGTDNGWTGMTGLLAVWPLTAALYLIVLLG